MARRPKLLVTSFVFPPMVAGGAVRMGRFAKYLPEFGWDVTVVTGPAADAVDVVAAQELPPEVRVVRVRAPVANMVGRHTAPASWGTEKWLWQVLRTGAHLALFPDRQVFWALAAAREAVALHREDPHDALLASYPPASSLLAGLLVEQRTGLPLVADFRDLWTDLPGQAFPSPLHALAARRLQERVIRRATTVIGVTPQMAQTLTERHPRGAEAAAVVPNGFDPAHLALVGDSRELSAPDRPFTLLYAGSLTAHYNLEAFWKALQTLLRNGSVSPDRLQVQFMANLSPKDPAHWGVEDLVQILPMRPHRDVFAAMNEADAMMLVERPGYYPRYTIAVKAFDYMLTGKPVLALTESPGHTADLLCEAGVGFCADPRNTVAIQEAIERLLRTKGSAPRPVRIGEAPFARHDRRALAGRLAGLLGEIISAGGSARADLEAPVA